MLAILTREVKNYLKSPLFWIGVVIVIFGVFLTVNPYLDTRYLAEGEEIANDYPGAVHEGEVYEGYVPSGEEQRREIWEHTIQENLIQSFHMSEKEAETAVTEMKGMDIKQACAHLEKEYSY